MPTPRSSPSPSTSGRSTPAAGGTPTSAAARARAFRSICRSLPGAGDATYRMGFARIVEPVVERFAPDLIVVVAGQDAAADDPLSDLMVTEAGFRGLAGRVRALADSCCDGRMLLILESGYNRSTPTGAHRRDRRGAARRRPARRSRGRILRRIASRTLHRRRLDDIAASLRPYWPLP